MMRWMAFVLLAVNAAFAAYLAFSPSALRKPTDTAALELNAERIKRIAKAGGKPLPDQPAVHLAACLEWAFFTAAELERARAELADAQVAHVGVRQAQPATTWWVYVPPLRSREEAERRIHELDELGVKGARVVDEERWRNAIALGSFVSEAAAIAHQQRLRDAKVRNAAVGPRNGAAPLWLIVIAEPTPAVAARLVELRTGFAGTDVRAVACAASGA
jgi:hypothetical protein